jgi:hypothetical protein
MASKRIPTDFQNHPIGFSEALNQGMFRAVGKHVVDGDTADFMVDLGWYHYTYLPIRVKDLDTPELRGTSGEEYKLAQAAKARAEDLIKEKPVLIKTSKGKVSFGRFIGDIYFIDEKDAFLGLSYLKIEPLKGESFYLYSLSDVLKKEGLIKQKKVLS